MKSIIRMLLYRFILAVAGFLILFLIGDTAAQTIKPKVALTDLKRAIIELKYIETRTRFFPYHYQLSQDFKLYLGPEDYNDFHNHLDKYSKDLYTSGDSIRIGLFGLRSFSRIEGEDFMVWSPDGNMLFTVLRDLPAFELVLNIFAVWSLESDTLTLECISDTVLVTGIGWASVEDLYQIDSTSSVIAGRTIGGDEGDYWGSVWLGLLQKPCDFKIFHRSEFRSSFCEKEQKLEYRIDEARMTAEIIKRERLVLNCDDYNNIDFSDWYLIEIDTLDFIEMTSDFQN